jgi:hypothetical protein
MPQMMLELHDECKKGRFFMTWIAALEEAEILCCVISDTSTSLIILPQALPLQICPGA